MTDDDRNRLRQVLRKLCLLCTVIVLAAANAAPEPAEERTMKRPWMLVTAEQIDGLRSLADVRKSIQEGRSAQLWEQLVAKVEREMKLAPKAPGQAGNRSYFVVQEAAYRIIDTALVALVTGERRYADAALQQVEALFDPEQWPDWRDKAHVEVGLNADLRHGQLARALGLAYDWLHVLLTAEERQRILDGLDHCAIPQFKAGVAAGEHWSRRRSNWMTCVVGGFGILGMGLGPDHPDGAWLAEFARPRMEGYMSVFGPEGEFNETVAYSGSTMYVVDYLLADRYASAGRRNLLKQHKLDAFCRWYLYGILPPDRVVGFGDPLPDMPPAVAHFAAVASALRDPLIQWVYLEYAELVPDYYRQRAGELLYYDPTVDAESPEGQLPLGRAYHTQGRLVSSRSSWDPTCPTSVVYAKAGKEDYHCHADWGQVCIDGFGERLIVDLGSPKGGYPKTHKERYYNYQQWGHNVLVLDPNETGGHTWNERLQGETIWSEFDDARGAAWTMDLSQVYGDGARIRRHVVHLLPRVAVVLDEAALADKQTISLRWHTIRPAEPDTEGRFTVRGQNALLTSRTLRLDGDARVNLGRHEYRPPFDSNRGGKPYSQRREPFVEIKAEADDCRMLSLFCVRRPDEPGGQWETADDGWSIETPEGVVRVRMAGESLMCERAADGRAWRVPIEMR